VNINATLLGQMIAFALFTWFCMKYVWPPMMAALTERQKKIAEGLDAASRAEHDLELAKQRVVEQLREGKDQAAAIIEQANRRGISIIEEAKEQARREVDRIKEGARAEIEQELMQAKEALRTQVAKLAVAGAERILQKAVNDEVDAELIDRLAGEL
jgi:F-type H+-transporting ATPase subunit b